MQTPEEALKEYFGHAAFRGRQKELVDALLEGRDALGVMPTGAGKSVCFQIPALLVPGLTLVVSPLISLMKDQVGALRQAGVPAACLNSAMPAEEQRAVFARALDGTLKLLYVSPERLELPGLRALFERVPLAYLAVDEAHCISQWGQDFRPSYGKIVDFLAALPERPPVGAFTATATEAVRQDIVRLLGLRDPLVCVSSFDRPNLTFYTEKPRDKREHLVTLLRERLGQSGIIYCSTRKTVDEVHEMLVARGFAAGRYHAGLDAASRRESQDDFLFDRIQVMVATNAFGMGIDKSNVSFVIHYNLPQNIESYYQEAGRAGRDGAAADCILLYSPRDVRTCEFLIEHGHDDAEEFDERTRQTLMERDRERLRQMTFYATTTDCLRRFLLKYFGEDAPLSCENCSSCLTKFELVDATLEAQKIVSCVYRLHQRGRTAGKAMIADILHGADNERIRKSGFDTLSTYGIMRQDSVKHIRDLLDRLLENGYLARTGGDYPVVTLCPKSDDIIRRRLPFAVKLPRDQRKKDSAAPAQSGLYEALRALRGELAAREKVPAYVIFSNATLQDMCARQPITESAFLEVSGVGRAKADKYGEEFLACIKRYMRGAEGQALPPGAASAQRISGRDPGLQRPWTEDEDGALRDESAQRLPLIEIAARHERPLGSVLARLKKLGLPVIR